MNEDLKEFKELIKKSQNRRNAMLESIDSNFDYEKTKKAEKDYNERLSYICEEFEPIVIKLDNPLYD